MTIQFRCGVALTILTVSGAVDAHTPGKIDTTSLPRPVFGVMVPLPDESRWLRQHIQQPHQVTRDGVTYTVGKLQDRSIVFLQSGLGKVNAALMADRLIADFHPDAVLMSGSAGNLNAHLTKDDVVIGQQVVNVDLGELTANGVRFVYPEALRNPQNQQSLPLVFKLDAYWSKYLPKSQQPNYLLGTIATSDALPNLPPQLKLLRGFNVDVVEMEGASLMQACWMFHTPCMVIRGISNNVDEAITLKDTQRAGDNAAQVLAQVIAHIPRQSSVN